MPGLRNHLCEPRACGGGDCRCLLGRCVCQPRGGAIFIVTHNRRSLSAAVMRSKSPIYDVEHFQLFSSRSMKVMLKSAGFGKVSVFPILNQYPLRYWVRLCPLSVPMKHRLEYLIM